MKVISYRGMKVISYRSIAMQGGWKGYFEAGGRTAAVVAAQHKRHNSIAEDL